MSPTFVDEGLETVRRLCRDPWRLHIPARPDRPSGLTFKMPVASLPRLIYKCDEMATRLLTDFELMILLAILRLAKQAYGVPIGEEIERATKRPVTRASIYTALDRLQRMGLVTSVMGDPTPERGGRAKRFFTVTPDGLRAVKEAQRAFATMWRGLRQLKGNLA
jgi:PadR family transcriptional regulator PadR